MAFNKKYIFYPVIFTGIISISIITANRFELIKKNPPSLILKTSPKNVRIRLDNKPLFNGKYVKTPMTIVSTPGKHRLQIIRTGFASKSIDFSLIGDQNVKLKRVVLKKLKGYRTKTVSISSKTKATFYANIDNGYIQSKVPFKTKSLELLKTHTLRLELKTRRQQMPKIMTCNFQLTVNKEKVHKIRIVKKKGEYILLGCHETY